MANINPMVAVAKALLKKNVPEEKTCIHYCIYHSRYPLAIRSSIENKLDKLLNRKKADAIWANEEIQQSIKKHPEAQHHIFIILASPVAEVGRDHDYDWAIVEPSSMRSIIQLAGRVLRHRNIVPDRPNMLLLGKNSKALGNNDICFERPGFESRNVKMESHDLFEVMSCEQYKKITAIMRIILPKSYQINEQGEYRNLIELEHKALENQLFNKDYGARLWWDNQPQWCGEVQRQQRFRNSKSDESYYLWVDDGNVPAKWKWKNDHVSPAEFGEPLISINKVELEEHGTGNHFWYQQDALAIYQALAQDFGWELWKVSQRFGEVRLTEYEKGNSGEYNYHPHLGVYQDIGSKS